MTNTETAFSENSITVFRSLIAELDFSRFKDAQLYDLSALASTLPKDCATACCA